MSHQKPHYRTSSRGRRFIAGRSSANYDSSRNSFSVKEGMKLAIRDRDHYAQMIEDPEKRRHFLEVVNSMIRESLSEARSGYDVARGTKIEKQYYIIGLGKTENEYTDYVRSLD